MENKNMPAFPKQKQVLGSGEDYQEMPGAEGLTKRELIAAMALQGFVSNATYYQGYSPNEDFARQAVSMADALLAELSKPQP